MTDSRTNEPDPCKMTHTPPFDFAQCETHDTTFPVGGACKWHGKESVAEVLQAEADEQRGLKVRAELELASLDELLRIAHRDRDAATAAIERVRVVHREEDNECVGCSFEAMPNVGFRGVSVPWPCPTRAALDGAPEPGLSESERLEIEGTPYVWSPDSLAYQLDGWVNDLGLPGNSTLEHFGVQEGVYYEDQSVLSEKLQAVTIAWLEEHGYRRGGAPEPDMSALREARAETWDEAIAAVHAWWSTPEAERPAMIVNPYGAGLPAEGEGKP